MNDGIYSISLLTNTTLVERETTSVTTLTTTKINSISMSSEETPGTSSSYYSTSSASSSAENISTVENGELSVFTFISPGHGGSSSARESYCTHSCGHLPSRYSNSCHSCHGSRRDTYDSFLNSDVNYGNSSDSSNFSIDPFHLGSSHMYSYKGSHRKQNHILSDNYVRLLPKVSEGLLLRSLEKGGKFMNKGNHYFSHH